MIAHMQTTTDSTGTGEPGRAGSGFRTRGHDTAIALVRAMIARRTPHALLVSGPPGVGKTTLALDLAAGFVEPAGPAGSSIVASIRTSSGSRPRVRPTRSGSAIVTGRIPERSADWRPISSCCRSRAALASRSSNARTG